MCVNPSNCHLQESCRERDSYLPAVPGCCYTVATCIDLPYHSGGWPRFEHLNLFISFTTGKVGLLNYVPKVELLRQLLQHN